MRTHLRTLLILTVVMVGTSACTSYEALATRRAERARRAGGTIGVALVWQERMSKSHFFEGAELAAAEINRDGGVGGRRVRPIRYVNQTGRVDRDLAIAREIAADADLVAAVGHSSDEGSIAASVVYDRGGVVYLASAATVVRFTQHRFPHVFRNVPSDRENGFQAADFAKRRGVGTALVLDDRTIYGKELADWFQEQAHRNGIQVVFRRSYNLTGTDFKSLFDEVKRLRFDLVFLGGSLPTAAEVIRQARLMGVTAPFMGGSGLDAPLLWEIAGPAAEGTVLPTVFHHQEERPAAAAFTRAFRARHQANPSTWAAVGYDAVQVLVHAIRKAGTAVPATVASHLRYVQDWDGALGRYDFLPNGDISGYRNRFQVVKNGAFQLIEKETP
jgi:branched-chain amino acid transport system substrate-binding protein